MDTKLSITLRGSLACLLAILALSGCAGQTIVRVVDPFPRPGKIDGGGTVDIEKIRFLGALNMRYQELYEPFLGAAAETGNQVKFARNPEYKDGSLAVTIGSSYSTSSLSKTKYVPLYGGMIHSISGGKLKFNWEATVNFVFFDADGEKMTEDSFRLDGEDSMEQQGGHYAGVGTIFAGAGIQAMMYPDDEAIKVMGDAFLKAAGREIANRLLAEPYASYFAERTRARDGMDPKAYQEFLARKKRLKGDRALRKEEISKSMMAQVEDVEGYDALGSGSVMVFGVGVDTYDHFPDLTYAARDAERMVKLFADRYDLSSEWATVLTNEEARAIGVRRFLEKNVRKLLKPEDTFIFYFSGHGMPDIDAGSEDGDGLRKYLLLSDSEPDALPLTAISLNDLAMLLGDLPCRRVLVFIDSCFSGEAGKDALSNMKNPLISDRTYANMAAVSGKGRVVMAASMENEPSLESRELESGVFTHFLMRKLQRSRGEGGPIQLDIFDLYRHVADEVEKFTRGRQSPVFRGELDRSILL